MKCLYFLSLIIPIYRNRNDTENPKELHKTPAADIIDSDIAVSCDSQMSAENLVMTHI